MKLLKLALAALMILGVSAYPVATESEAEDLVDDPFSDGCLICQ